MPEPVTNTGGNVRRKLTWILVGGAVVLGAVAYVGSASATPAVGFVGTTIAKGRFEAFDVMNHSFPDGFPRPWLSMQKTKEPSDLYVQNNVWTPGGSTGWHTHPGHSLIIVTAGTVTGYEGDDPTCTPHRYTAGMGFVDAGGGDVHLLRNEGSVEARTVAVQLIPADAIRRIDAPAPGFCSF
jgi:quercetin dioxygenase-like cupin family protein